MTRAWIRALHERNWMAIEKMIDETAKGSKKYNLIAHNNYALRLAAQCGETEICRKLLLHEGSDAAARNNEAIQEAAAGGHLAIVKLILEHGKADATDRNHFALHRALFTAHFGVFELLCATVYASETKASIAKKALRSENFRTLTLVSQRGVLQYLDKNGFIAALVVDDFSIRPKQVWRLENKLVKYYFFPNTPLLPKTRALLAANRASLMHVLYLSYTKFHPAVDYGNSYIRKDYRIGFDTIFTARPLLEHFDNYWRQYRKNLSDYNPRSWFTLCRQQTENKLYAGESLLPALGYFARESLKRPVVRCKYELCVETLLKLRRGLAQLSLPRLILIQIFYVVQEPISHCIDMDIPWNILDAADKCS